MRNQTKITVNIKGLEELGRELSGSGYVARVGIFGGKATRNGGVINNPTLGLVHEVGSESQGIPARSWLRMPIEHESESIVNKMGSAAVKEALEKKRYKRIFQLLGVAAEVAIQKAFASGGFGQWAPIKASTIRAKGSSKVLINTRQLARSVGSDVVRRSEL